MSATVESLPSAAEKGFGRWVRSLRGSSRLSFILHLVTRLTTSALTLVWTPLLLGAMGKPLNGLFLSFQSLAQLGGLGDLGMGGAVGIRAGQYLGEDKPEALQNFLASARTVFLLLGLTVGGAVMLFSPGLPQWFHFRAEQGAGPLPWLFAVGSISVCMVVLSSYVKNLNYACGTVLWPIIPSFLLLQGSVFVHWWLARQVRPLWIQYLPYSIAALIDFALACFYLRAAFPSLAKVLPLRFDFRAIVGLFESSFWMYLISLGYVIYMATDRLIIQAFFGPEQVPVYNYNFRPCELALTLVITAGFVIMPKLTQWLAASGPEARERTLASLERLNQFQTLLGCAAAVGYLAINDFFMTHWLGADMRAPLSWQVAFALNLAVTAGRDAGFQVATRCGAQGLRFVGLLVGATAALNLGLALLAAKLGSIFGIAAVATVVQSVLGLGTGLYSCRHLKIAWFPWALKNWVAPVIAVSLAAAGRVFVPFDSAGNCMLLLAGYAVLILAVAWLLGVRPSLIREEWKLVRSFLGSR